MLSFEKPPVLIHPEVRDNEKLTREQKIESLAYEYKVNRDEMLSIFDEMKDFFTYQELEKIKLLSTEDWARSITDDNERRREETGDGLDDDELSSLIFDYGEQVKRFDEVKGDILKEYEDQENEMDFGEHKDFYKAARRGKGKSLLFGQFKRLASECGIVIGDLIVDGVSAKKIDKMERDKDVSKKENNKDSVVAGISARAGYELLSFCEKVQRLEQFSDDEMNDMKLYRKDLFYLGDEGNEKKTRGKVYQNIAKYRRSVLGVKVASESKGKESIQATENVAQQRGIDHKKTKTMALVMQNSIRRRCGVNITIGMEKTYDKEGNFISKEFLPAYVHYNREMKRLRLMLNEGKIVEAKYIKDVINEAMPFLRKNPPTIVFLHGDFGTGKTALATHISKTKFGKEPILVAGSKFLEPERFTEEFRLAMRDNAELLNELHEKYGIGSRVTEQTKDDEINSAFLGGRDEMRERLTLERLRGRFDKEIMNPDNFKDKESLAEYEAEFVRWSKENRDLIPEAAKSDVEKQLDSLFENKIMGRYVLGEMYKAMKEGRPLIIDEANAISPDVLIAFNDLLTKKIGSSIRARSAEFEIMEGYCVMWTGNTGERYKHARFNDIDPATYSRVHAIKLEYLPQSKGAGNEAGGYLERMQLDKIADKTFADETEMLKAVKDSKEKAANDQIFQVLVIKLLNSRNGALLLTKKDDEFSLFKDLYKLSAGARILMDMFEGRADKISFPGIENIIGGSNTPTELMTSLQKANLSMRELIDNIIGGFLDNGQSMDIEYYAFNFVKKYNNFPREQAILYAVLSSVGLFNPVDGWPNWSSVAHSGLASQVGKLAEFTSQININPLDKVGKYKKIESNGSYFSILDAHNQDGDDIYQYRYFSDLEMQQLIFGYLPAKKSSDYAGISTKLTARDREKSESLAFDERFENLHSELMEIVGALDDTYFADDKEAKRFYAEIRKFLVMNSDAKEKVSEEQLLADTENLCNYILDFLQTKNIVSADEIATATTIDDKIALLKNALKNNV